MKDLDKPHEDFDQFAETLVELLKSFQDVMKTEDENTKILAIEMLSELKEKMGETFYDLMQKHDVYPEDLESFLEEEDNEMNKRVRSVNSEITKINKEVSPIIEKTLVDAGLSKPKRKRKLKKKMVKRLKSTD